MTRHPTMMAAPVRGRRLGLALATVALLAACAPAPAPTFRPATPPPTPDITPEPTPRPVISTRGTLEWELIDTGMKEPTAFVDAGDGRFFITEQFGRVRVVEDGKLDSKPLIDIREHVLANGERGLLGIALHPDFATNERYFLMYSNVDGHTEIREYGPDVEPRQGQNIGQPPPSGEPPDIPGRLVLLLPQYRIWHKGGDMHFGADGYLYVSVGEDGRQDYEPTDTRELRGVILRIDVDDDVAWRYAIPPDNPFAGGGGAPEIWDYGLRNPWRFSFDSATGDMYIGDVGQSTYEEINRHPAGVPGGLDFGWIRTEGPDCRQPGCDTAGITFPLVAYDHTNGDCAVVGGYVVRRPGHVLEGRYLYGDLCSGRIWSVDRADPATVVEEMNTGYRISSFGQDDDGRIYVLAHFDNGRLYRIVD